MKTTTSQQPHCSNKPMLVVQSKIKLVGKNKTGPLKGDSTLQYNINHTHKFTECHDTTMDSLNIHKLIIDHMQTGNSEPQYQEATSESSPSLEYDAPYDHMFEQSELEQNT